MSEVCFICDKPLKESEVVVVDRGMKTLIDASVERNDNFFEYLKDKQSVTVHVQCRKMYTRKSSIVAAKRQREPEEGSTSTISPPHTRARVARTRSGDVAKAVIARIGYEFDLIAAEAKYHNNCYIIFLRPTTGYKVGRPEDDSVNLAMEEIFQYIKNNDDCQFSLQELKYIDKNPTIDNKSIKRRLKLKYGDKIIITEKKGSLTIICFIDNQYDILNKAWYENKNKIQTKNDSEY
ncbi:unnamed protein product [Pieris macdunnoughi]|uniref:Uncharacterized protein n=1 Tax=Pieris macdunnoughi TaxID=345717 RepID=A0A821X674_9NEOP|nr:unnamed protein product [Pieris macdunnoughi]